MSASMLQIMPGGIVERLEVKVIDENHVSIKTDCWTLDRQHLLNLLDLFDGLEKKEAAE